VLASDRIRKDLAARDRNGGAPTETNEVPFGAGLYSAKWNERTYQAMLDRASALLRSGHSAILDATFSRRADRDAAFELAGNAGAEAALVECRVPDRVALSRLVRRSRNGRSISDGRAELFPAQKRAFEPIREVPRNRHLTLRGDRRFGFPGSDALLAAPR
jgi:hypothetical protein